jgi:hypothetical protein
MEGDLKRLVECKNRTQVAVLTEETKIIMYEYAEIIKRDFYLIENAYKNKEISQEFYEGMMDSMLQKAVSFLKRIIPGVSGGAQQVSPQDLKSKVEQVLNDPKNAW